MGGLRRQLEALGLAGNEARCVLGLLRVGSATATELSRVAGVPRTAIYALLEALEAKHLVDQVCGDGSGPRSTQWATPGRVELLARLRTAQRLRLREAEALIDQLDSSLEAALPDHPPAPLPYLHLIRDASQNRVVYERLLEAAEVEVLVFNKAPYSWASGPVNPAVLDALARGVDARAIYEAGPLYHPDAGEFRREHEAYMAAGVRGVVVDELPLKLAVFDRKAVLTAVVDQALSAPGYPTALLIEHPAYAAASAATFEHHWAQGHPYRPVDSSTPNLGEASHHVSQ